MALERRNPLPAGVYWQDFFTPAVSLKSGTIEDFLAWVAANRDTVLLRKTEEKPGDRRQLWALFEVKAPVTWDALRFGFPTVAPKGLQTSEADVIQRPDPEKEVLDQIGEVLTPRNIFGVAAESFAVLVAVVGAVAALKYLPGRK